MEDLFDFLTQSAFQEINEHNKIANNKYGNNKYVPKAHSTNRQLRDLSSLKLRERLIHLLALKPFTQRELNARLQKDGIRKPEKSLIGNVLAEIAQLSNNEFCLKSCMWNEVKPNWSYYTAQERQQLKLRKTQKLSIPTISNEVTTISSQTSAPIISASLPIHKEAVNEISGKRPCLEHEEPQNNKKRRRVVGNSNNIYSQPNIKNIGNKSQCNGAQPDHKEIPHKEPVLQTTSKVSSNNTAEKSQHQELTRQKIQKVSGDGNHKKSSQKESVLKTASDTIYKNNQCQESVSEIASTFSAVNTIKNKHHQKPVLQTYIAVPDGDIYKSQQYQKPLGISERSQHLEPALQLKNKVSDRAIHKKSTQKEPASEVAVTDMYQNYQRQESVPKFASKFLSVETIENKQHRKPVPQTYAVVPGSDICKSHQQKRPAGIPEKMKQESIVQINNKVSGIDTQRRSLEAVIKTASEVTVTDIYKNNKRQEYVSQVASKVSANDTNKNDKHQKQAFQTNSVASGGDIYKSHQHRKPVLQTTTTEHPVIAKKVIPSYDFSLYSTVQSIEQRCEYKYDFERIYEEYFRLRQRIEEVRYIFRVLPEQLKNVPEGSSEYQRIANRIFAEYERLNSKEEIELKRRFDYLEAKLIHIKQRVDDFDQKQAKENAAQAALAAYSQR
ncbi:RNA polymerase II elongation factor ELL2-like [Bactrocera dorsalis]|uniref:RNA polymerase II elongation factor ELL2-like n=1 Tax=Bactrocera dorsalis TaxID=27457 RepID=A0A6I9V7X3_BACDO|nr:RNA polymerase II elongation factor ELL2-like [Bactrocera dorsalis]